MNKTIFISDLQSDLGFTLLKHYYLKGYRVVGFTTGDPANLSLKEFKKEQIEISTWNRSSPIGIKNVLLKGIKKFKTIDEAFVVQSHIMETTPLAQLSAIDINQKIDTLLKGTLFMVKELEAFFQGRPGGTIAVINHIIPNQSTLGDILKTALGALVKNIFQEIEKEKLILTGFESTSIQYEEFCGYIYKILTERGVKGSGKLFQYSDKKGIFGF